MLFPISDLCSMIGPGDVAAFNQIVAVLLRSSICQVIDLACLDEDDVEIVMQSEPNLMPLCLDVWRRALGYKRGWASLVSL